MRHAWHHMDGVRARAHGRARARVRVRVRVRDRRPKPHRSSMIRPMGGCEGIRSSRSSTTAQPYMPPKIEHMHPPARVDVIIRHWQWQDSQMG